MSNTRITFTVPAGLTPEECTICVDLEYEQVRMTCSCNDVSSEHGCPHFLEVLTCSREVVTTENADAICELLTRIHGSETQTFAKEILVARAELEAAQELFRDSCQALTRALSENEEFPPSLRLLRSPRLSQVKIPLYPDGMPDVMELD